MSRATLAILAASVLLCGCGSSSESDVGAGKSELENLRDGLRDNPDDVSLRLQIARLHLAHGDGAAAESYLRRALADGSDDKRASGDLVRSLLMQEKPFEAQALLEPLIAAAGESDARLWMLRGEALGGQPSVDTAEVMRSYLKAFHSLSVAPDPQTAARLAVLSQQDPIAGSAKSHFECHAQAATLIDPPPAAGTAETTRVLRVGPSRDLRTPSAAARIAHDGDVIEIDAGVYRGDSATWLQSRLTLRGVGGIAQLEAVGPIENGKAIWVFEGDDVTVENMSFSGASVPYHNGTGIRLHGKGATIRNSEFRDNEGGIMSANLGDVPGNDILIEFSIFERNGYGDGLSHNIYIGRVRSFTLRYSYSHASHIGHLVKSRARYNAILFNRLIDGEDGNGSYVIDLPEGGRAWIVGNELHQGPAADNPHMISFGEELDPGGDQALYVVNNTLYNGVLDGTLVRNATTANVVIANNLIAGGRAIILRGPGEETHNLRRPGPWFRDAAVYDFRLTPQAPAIDAGLDPATIAGLRYFPDAEYRHPARGQTRKAVSTIDIGAREFCGY